MAGDVPLGYYEGPVDTLLDALIEARLEGAVVDVIPDPADEIETTWPADAASLRRLRAHMLSTDLPLLDLRVRDGGGTLLDAPDLSCDDIWVSERLPRDAVERIRGVLGDWLGPPRYRPDEPA